MKLTPADLHSFHIELTANEKAILLRAFRICDEADTKLREAYGDPDLENLFNDAATVLQYLIPTEPK